MPARLARCNHSLLCHVHLSCSLLLRRVPPTIRGAPCNPSHTLLAHLLFPREEHSALPGLLARLPCISRRLRWLLTAGAQQVAHGTDASARQGPLTLPAPP